MGLVGLLGNWMFIELRCLGDFAFAKSRFHQQVGDFEESEKSGMCTWLLNLKRSINYFLNLIEI